MAIRRHILSACPYEKLLEPVLKRKNVAACIKAHIKLLVPDAHKRAHKTG
jgi:hypothetical protein